MGSADEAEEHNENCMTADVTEESAAIAAAEEVTSLLGCRIPTCNSVHAP